MIDRGVEYFYRCRRHQSISELVLLVQKCFCQGGQYLHLRNNTNGGPHSSDGPHTHGGPHTYGVPQTHGEYHSLSECTYIQFQCALIHCLRRRSIERFPLVFLKYFAFLSCALRCLGHLHEERIRCSSPGKCKCARKYVGKSYILHSRYLLRSIAAITKSRRAFHSPTPYTLPRTSILYQPWR